MYIENRIAQMNILYITHTTDGSGARVALTNMARGMINMGHHVFVITPTNNCIVSDNMREIGAKVIVAPVCSTAYPKTKNVLKWTISLILRLYKWNKSKKCIHNAILNNNIDIVHTNVGPLNLAPSVCRKLGIPHVWHIREFQTEFFIKFFPLPSHFRKEIIKDGNYNIAITKAIFDYFSLRENIDKVIYDGVFSENIANQSTIPFKQREKNILFVGRVEDAKGTLDLIKAFILFHHAHKDWKLQIVGNYKEDSAYYRDCITISEKSGCNNDISFLGKRNNVYEFMRNARILVMSSKSEGFGFVTTEAMANGCLVIGRNTSGTKEQMDNGKLLTGEEVALRFETLDELISQMNNAAEKDYSEMIERGRRAAIELYSLEKTSEQVEQYYKWIKKNYNEKES